MIQAVYIINSDGLLLFEKRFTQQAKALFKKDPALLAGYIKAITSFASDLGQKQTESITFDKDKFLCGNFNEIFVVFYVDKTADEYILRKKMRRVADIFLLKYETVLQNWNADLNVFQDFEIDSVVKSTINIVFLGLPNVGKTTIYNLIKGFPIPTEYIPTIEFRLTDIKISEENQISLCDLTGSEKYRRHWLNLLENADIIFLVFAL